MQGTPGNEVRSGKCGEHLGTGLKSGCLLKLEEEVNHHC